MKRIVIIIAVIVCLLLSYFVYGATFGSNSKLGLIDLNRIKKEAIVYQNLREELGRLQEELEDFQGEILSQHRLEVEKLTNEYHNQLQEETEQAKDLQKEYEQKIKELAANSQKIIDEKEEKQELILEEKSLLANNELDAAVTRIVKKWKLSCVLHKNGVTVGGRDVTDDVIKQLDKKYKPSIWQRIFKRTKG